MVRLLRALLLALLAAAALGALLGRAGAAQRAPGWWDPDGVGSGADWHYRIPVTLPATSSINSTARVDIDFVTRMAQLGLSGTFDPASVRVIRPGGELATSQEFTDTIYAGATDPVGNQRGEVRWIVQDGGAQTYYVYFDITQNGAKSANPQTPVNGNFEHSSAGTQLPAGWTSAVKSNALYDMQVRPSETVAVTTDGSAQDNPWNTDGSPQSGQFSYLLGARSNNEPSTGSAQPNSTVLTRTFVVPATNPGNLTVNWRVEGWDSENYDNLYITVSSGASTTTVVGNSLSSYTTWPNSPNIGGNQARNNAAGYGQYNGYDMSLGGNHQAGMTVALHSEQWWNRTISLSAFAGQTVTLTIGTNSTQQFRSWFHVDNIEWSVVNGTVGNAEAFGVAGTFPAGALAPGQAVRVTAALDARPTGAGTPVIADIYYPGGGVFAGGLVLYNDGQHGDGLANDRTWASNEVVIPLNTPTSSGWTFRVVARDASTGSFGENGLAHRSGQGTALTLANWWNIDEGSFSVERAAVSVAKSMMVYSDGVNSANFKAIPGAQVRYCVTISNAGPATAGTVLASDPLPATLSFVPGSMASGDSCALAATPEDDDSSGADEADPIGASFSGGAVTITRGSLVSAKTFAVTYRATVN